MLNNKFKTIQISRKFHRRLVKTAADHDIPLYKMLELYAKLADRHVRLMRVLTTHPEIYKQMKLLHLI